MIPLLLLTSILILTSPLSALKCHFHIDSNKNYNCELSNAAPTEQSFNHTIDGYDDANVTVISSIIEEASILPVLDDFLMRKFINLRKVEISFFHVKEVTAGAFEVCDNIEEISLNRNDLSDLPAGVFRNCQKLKILKLASNLFTKVPADGFEGLKSLEVLKIDYNPLIEVMDDDFRYLTGLKEVYVSATGISSFNVSNFEVLDLRNNNFKYFEVMDAPGLRSLNISRNLLTYIKFSSSSNLTELDISMNALVDLPLHTFRNLNSLKTLKLSWNQEIFKNINRGTFLGLKSLETLELISCEISEFSEYSFYSLESLQELDLSHNIIQELPDIFSYKNLPNLKVLRISSNSIKQIKSTTFTRLTSLAILDLNHNFISKIDSNAFKLLENLVKLNLGSNKIEFLEISMFPDKNLKLAELDVSHNLIKAIEPGFLDKFGKNLKFLGVGNPCIDKSATQGLEICNKNYEELKDEQASTTTTTEATTEEIAEKLEFSLKDLLITLICIIFIAIVLIIIAFYINGILNLFGIYEKPIINDDNSNSVAYQKF